MSTQERSTVSEIYFANNTTKNNQGGFTYKPAT